MSPVSLRPARALTAGTPRRATRASATREVTRPLGTGVWTLAGAARAMGVDRSRSSRDKNRFFAIRGRRRIARELEETNWDVLRAERPNPKFYDYAVGTE